MIKIEFDRISEKYSVFEINEKVQPDTGGIYFFYDVNHDLIYVGRSINLKNRLFSHVNGLTHTAYCCEDFTYFRIMYTNSKTEQKIYELYAIQQFKPKYNKTDAYDEQEDDIHIMTSDEIERARFNNFILEFLKVNKSTSIGIEIVKEICENNGFINVKLTDSQTLTFLENNRVTFKNRKFCYK